MQNIYDQPNKVRGLGNTLRRLTLSDFKKSNSEITMDTETIPDLGVVQVFTMDYNDGSINFIVTENGDLVVGGVASLDIIIVDNNADPVDLAVVEFTVNDTTETKITDDTGECSFPINTEVADTFEFSLVATYEDKTATFNDKYIIVDGDE